MKNPSLSVQNKQQIGSAQLSALQDLEIFVPDSTAHDNSLLKALKTANRS